MTIAKPFKRTCRPFVSGNYSVSLDSYYLRHEKFANDPQHYVRAFLMLQEDLMELFKYIEPDDQNLSTYSHKIQQLLTRVCIELEANWTAILKENGYKKQSNNLNIEDYNLIEFSHRLSKFQVRIPNWSGAKNIRAPFTNWAEGTDNQLEWYRAYNKAKHDRHSHFKYATFDNLLDALSALAIVLASQFYQEDYSHQPDTLIVGGGYGSDDEMTSSIGGFFRIKYPTDWAVKERYDFDWKSLSQKSEPFADFDYNQLRRIRCEAIEAKKVKSPRHRKAKNY
jgi:hypothetical protein